MGLHGSHLKTVLRIVQETLLIVSKTGVVVFGGTNIFADEMCVFCVYIFGYFHLHELVVLSCSELD